MKKILSLFSLCLILTSCSFFKSPKHEIDVNNKDGVTFKEHRKYLGYHDLPSTGDSKILVIPVIFSDCTFSQEKLEEEHENLNKAFFGTDEETYIGSVSSYYKKSSYNKLNITGKVSPYFELGKTVYQANNVYNDQNGLEPTYDILTKAIDWYKSQFDDISDFDSDKDGYIDSVWLIYMEEYNTNYFKRHPMYTRVNNLSQFLWAYTYWYTNSSANKLSPNPFAYSWASYSFMHEADSNLIDSHTYIHETGHLFGLEDYYNYDRSTLDLTCPTGFLDMMDANILDHNAYSKFLLGWIEPRVLIDDGEYELKNFQDTGDAIIIPSTTWNGSQLDEYLILELYTPTGLNLVDSQNQYSKNYPLGFTQNGIKIYHVDSRLGKFTVKEGKMIFDSYLTDSAKFYSDARKYPIVDIVNSNTPSKSYVENNRLITLLSSTGKNDYFKTSSGNYATNKDLFKDGSHLKGFKFHQYNDYDLSIKINDVALASCSLSIANIG